MVQEEIKSSTHFQIGDPADPPDNSAEEITANLIIGQSPGCHPDNVSNSLV